MNMRLSSFSKKKQEAEVTLHLVRQPRSEKPEPQQFIPLCFHDGFVVGSKYAIEPLCPITFGVVRKSDPLGEGMTRIS